MFCRIPRRDACLRRSAGDAQLLGYRTVIRLAVASPPFLFMENDMRTEDFEKGMRVAYFKRPKRPEYGVVSSVNEKFVFVKYDNAITQMITGDEDYTAAATRPEDLKYSYIDLNNEQVELVRQACCEGCKSDIFFPDSDCRFRCNVFAREALRHKKIRS